MHREEGSSTCSRRDTGYKEPLESVRQENAESSWTIWKVSTAAKKKLQSMKDNPKAAYSHCKQPQRLCLLLLPKSIRWGDCGTLHSPFTTSPLVLGCVSQLQHCMEATAPPHLWYNQTDCDRSLLISWLSCFSRESDFCGEMSCRSQRLPLNGSKLLWK